MEAIMVFLSKYYKVLILLVIVILLILAGFYIHHKGYTSGVADTQASVKKSSDDADKKMKALSDQLSKEEAASQAQIAALENQIATQPSKEKIVYVKVKVPGKTVYVSEPISGPVYITNGAVSLYDASLPGLLPATSASPNEASSTLPSNVTVSDYQSTTLSNNAACYSNTNALILLQKYEEALPHKPGVN